MYAVIFTARITNLSGEYQNTAIRMRELALLKYGCTKIISSYENDTEITISYWENLKQIQYWKQDKEHVIAQEMGQSKWYESYTVQITEILREYHDNN